MVRNFGLGNSKSNVSVIPLKESPMRLARNFVDKIYFILVPDNEMEVNESFQYKLTVVTIALGLLSSAILGIFTIHP